MFKRTKDYAKTLFERCLAEESVNSRAIYLFHGLASGIGIIVLVIGFAIGKIHDGADSMILALSGQQGAAAIGRYLTKKDSKAESKDPPSDDKGQ